ncbi:MAG: MFS transporter [Chloroflexi bacterium]|nr:MFS transporter [Chloroflexota bacterium]MDA1174519.1 MFS transporter [Chloroflexota bacterium]
MSAPKPPKRPRIFYGWYIIGLSGASAIFAGTTSQAFFGVFLKPIEDDTGWTRASIAGAVTFATFVGGGIAFFIGRLADRYGPRVLMTIGVVIYAAGYAGMLFVTQVWQLYIAFFLARMASLQFLAGVVPRTTAVNWFRRMRGRALGFQTMAMPLGGAILASVAGALIASGMPWRTVLAVFGLGALALLAIPMPLIMRRQPEDMGLLPDGDIAVLSDDDSAVQARNRGGESSWTLKRTLHTKTMWLIVWGSLLQTMASGGIAFHMTAHFQESGLSTQVAASGASAFLLGGALSSTLWGFLTERYDERLLVVTASAVAMALAFWGSIVADPVSVIIFAALYGATTRGEGALVMMMLAAYYGRRSFGAISGFANTFTMMGLGTGPFLYAWLYGLRGEYEIIFNTSGVIMAIATILMWLAKRPSDKPEVESGPEQGQAASASAE